MLSPVIKRTEINGSTFFEKGKVKKISSSKLSTGFIEILSLQKFMSINYVLEFWCLKGNIVKFQPPHVRKQNVDDQF